MGYLVVGFVALVVSCLTLFTGFGLGTLLLPAFALFFPVAVAVAATAVVHAANNIFKLLLLHKSADGRIVARFGLPAIVTALFGAWLLSTLSGFEPVWVWHLNGREAVVTPVKLVMGTLIFCFALLDLTPGLQGVRVDKRWLPVGGLLSGFFGGLSGHQGALRAAFLRRLDMTPTAFAATQAVIATLVDGARLLVYGTEYFRGRMAGVESPEEWLLVGTATVFAFVGALIGKRLLPRVRLDAMRYLTGALLLIVGLGIGLGLV
jgi:uncharacterized membrane protein YfcA